LQSLGYRQVIKYLAGESKWEETLRLINRDTGHYAKRQMTWFTADKEINWFNPDSSEEIKKNVEKFWKEMGYH
jgi:tRNA dimethylallyltransferase